MAPVQAQEVASRDERVRQTRELKRATVKEEARAPAVISPRSKGLIAGLSAVLEPYNYGEVEIHSLVKRCGHDEGRIQAAVSNILEDKRGHELENWSTTATATERKLRAQEAKERRAQRERAQAEEAERQRAQRTKAADEKMRRAMEDAEKRRPNENDKGPHAAARGLGRGGACAWKPVASARKPSPDQHDDTHEVTSASCADDSTLDAATGSREEGKHDDAAQEDSAESISVSSKAEVPVEEADASPVAASLDEAPASPASTGSVGQPCEGKEAMVGSQAQASPRDRSAWTAEQGDEVPVTAEAEQGGEADVTMAHTEVSPQNGRVTLLDCPSVVMPPSYAEIIGNGPEPVVRFGSL